MKATGAEERERQQRRWGLLSAVLGKKITHYINPLEVVKNYCISYYLTQNVEASGL